MPGRALLQLRVPTGLPPNPGPAAHLVLSGGLLNDMHGWLALYFCAKHWQVHGCRPVRRLQQILRGWPPNSRPSSHLVLGGGLLCDVHVWLELRFCAKQWQMHGCRPVWGLVQQRVPTGLPLHPRPSCAPGAEWRSPL